MKPVRVKFDHTEEIWNNVVVEADPDLEEVCVEEENIDTFVVEYPSEVKFSNALTRFDGMVEYKKLP